MDLARRKLNERALAIQVQRAKAMTERLRGVCDALCLACAAHAIACVGDLPAIATTDAQSRDSAVGTADDTGTTEIRAAEASTSDTSIGAVDSAWDGTTGPPSCRGLPKTCGADGEGDCCESLVVPGGDFVRKGLESADGGVPRGRVSTFRLDKYKVTVGRFRKFVDAVVGGFNPPVGSGKHIHLPGGQIPGETGWQYGTLWPTTVLWAQVLEGPDTGETWTAEPGANDLHPINFIDWREAYAFCLWDGGFLPTDLERHYAAAGGDEQRYYPWSNPPEATTIDWTFASYGDGSGSRCYGDPSFGGLVHRCGLDDFTIPGTKPNGDGRWGHSDLAGTLWEFELDCAAPSIAADCEDCAYIAQECSFLPGGGSARMIRSGDFASTSEVLRTDNALQSAGNERHIYIGFRCARPP